jgi:hypothetical protein
MISVSNATDAAVIKAFAGIPALAAGKVDNRLVSDIWPGLCKYGAGCGGACWKVLGCRRSHPAVWFVSYLASRQFGR